MAHSQLNTRPGQAKKQISWLLITCFLIWCMIMLGGATRLTHAGLSIVEWKPITGIIPPLSPDEWLAEFSKYQQFPEYLTNNPDMTLAEFQFIFWMEFAHRLLGRLLGLAFALPLVVFWAQGCLPAFVKRRSFFALFLGGAQGFMGWYMVKSGLVKDPHVSHYRLTVHLMLAIALFSLLLWTAFDLTKKNHTSSDPASLTSHSTNSTIQFLGLLSCGMIILTIIYGGLVAGLKAGLIYNTFPLMGGQWVPSEWLDITPLYMNFFENPATVQWIHRGLAMTTFTLILITVIFCLKQNRSPSSSPSLRRASILWIHAAVLQVILGILTLLYMVPTSLGTLHQGTAVIVLATGLWFVWLSKNTPTTHRSTTTGLS